MSENPKELVEIDDDFINNKRYDYSLKKLLEKHQDGVSNKVIAQSLMIEEQEVEALYENIIVKLRSIMKINV